FGTNTILTGTGNDVINVGSQAGVNGQNTGGTLDGIAAALTIEGQGQTNVDRLDLDDSGDTDGETGVLSPATLSGFGLASAITYPNFEVLFLGLGSGADRLLIRDTHGDQTTVDAGPGADQVHVRTLAGPTFIRGNAGDDRVSAGTNFDASLFDAVIDHANAPPGGTIDLLTALLRVYGR